MNKQSSGMLPSILVSVLVFCMGSCVTYLILKGRTRTEQTSTTRFEQLKIAAEQAYVETQLYNNFRIGQQDLANVKFTAIETSGNKRPLTFGDMFKKEPKKKFVIRYSEIGCNTCVNLLFKNPQLLAELRKKYEVMVLVDFAKYENYVVWKRTSEIKDNIFTLKHDSLSFDRVFKSSSYCFIVDRDQKTYGYFKPDNMFPAFVEKYVNNITDRTESKI